MGSPCPDHARRPRTEQIVSRGTSLAASGGVHRLTWALLFASACVYDPPAVLEDPDPEDPRPTDPDPRLACMRDGTLLCLELEHGLTEAEDVTLAIDSSGNGFDAEGTLVEAATRVVDPVVLDASAARFGGASSLMIDDQLGIANSVTVELWAQHLTSIGVNRLFDSSGRFYIGRNLENQIECGINDGGALSVDSSRTIADAGWHHLACVFDATSRDIKIYIDGSVEDCEQLATTIDTTRSAPTGIGLGFVGLLDSVRVYASALSPDAICANAGRSSCEARCPTNGGGQGGQGGWGDDDD